jgi:hypothetical protein
MHTKHDPLLMGGPMPLNRGVRRRAKTFAVLFLLPSAVFLSRGETITYTDKGPQAFSSNGDASLRTVMLYSSGILLRERWSDSLVPSEHYRAASTYLLLITQYCIAALCKPQIVLLTPSRLLVPLMLQYLRAVLCVAAALAIHPTTPSACTPLSCF